MSDAPRSYEFWLIVFFFVLSVVSSSIGFYELGIKSVRNQAVEKGYARWLKDANEKEFFVWNERSTK